MLSRACPWGLYQCLLKTRVGQIGVFENNHLEMRMQGFARRKEEIEHPAYCIQIGIGPHRFLGRAGQCAIGLQRREVHLAGLIENKESGNWPLLLHEVAVHREKRD